jgi:hypothetical protein
LGDGSMARGDEQYVIELKPQLLFSLPHCSYAHFGKFLFLAIPLLMFHYCVL